MRHLGDRYREWMFKGQKPKSPSLRYAWLSKCLAVKYGIFKREIPEENPLKRVNDYFVSVEFIPANGLRRDRRLQALLAFLFLLVAGIVAAVAQDTTVCNLTNETTALGADEILTAQCGGATNERLSLTEVWAGHDTATTYSGAGTCSASNFVTATNDEAGPTCAQPVVSDLGSSSSSDLSTVLSDETGTGVAVFADAPTMTAALVSGTGAQSNVTITETSTADPELTLGLSAGQSYMIYVDNSDADEFSIRDVTGGFDFFIADVGVDENTIHLGAISDIGFGTDPLGNPVKYTWDSGNVTFPSYGGEPYQYVMGHNGSMGLSLIASTTGAVRISLGSADAIKDGFIGYQVFNNVMTFGTDGTDKTMLFADGCWYYSLGIVGFGTEACAADVLVTFEDNNASVHFEGKTTGQRNAVTISNGMFEFDQTTNNFYGGMSNAWEQFFSTKDGALADDDLSDDLITALSGVTTVTSGSYCQAGPGSSVDCDVTQANIPGANHIDASSEIADGTIDALDLDTEARTESCAHVTWESPVATDEITLRLPPFAGTIVEIGGESYGGTSVTIKACDGEDRGDDTCTTNLLDATETTTLALTTSGATDTAINSGGFAARDKITYVVTAVSGTPDAVEIYMNCRRD